MLCPQPQPSFPDVLVWMLSGRRRVAWARIPAQDVLFSVVEEERGRDCGKIQSLLLTVRTLRVQLLGRGRKVGSQERAGLQRSKPVVPNWESHTLFNSTKLRGDYAFLFF